jgi:hypothetical protein
MNTIARKQEYEARFAQWAAMDPERKSKYGSLLPSYRDLYSSLRVYNLVNSYTNEVMGGAEAIGLSRNIRRLIDLYDQGATEEALATAKNAMLEYSKEFFKDYNMETDKKLFVAVMRLYGENISPDWQVPEYIKFRAACKGDFSAAAEKLYSKSVFTDQKRYDDFIKSFSQSAIAKVRKDQFYLLATGTSDFISARVRGELTRITNEIQKLNRIYMAAQMEYEPERVFYPDANSTLRVAYGEVKGYRARDAVMYTPSSTLTGIIEKDNPAIYDYDVPDKLKELYRNKDFGRYAKDGDVPVCFIANNHTTGGNSGSPVINADGHLIGVNFDRAWEGVASDMAFNPGQSRNISLDIRYALFIIDKFAGAGYLLEEMKIIE